MLDRRGFLGTGAAAIAAAVARFGGVLLAEPAPEVKTGGIRMLPVDGKYRVWTKKVGRGPIKLLTLHGGPGCTHEYFECFEDFLPQEGVEFYYYDQLGSAYSDQPDDTSLWTIDRFREEVEQVRRGAGPRELLSPRPLLGQHARDRVRAQVPAAPEGPRPLRA